MPITTLLVANRGEIARRIFRTARTLGMRCVAVYVDADVDAPFVADADEAVLLTASYLDGPAVVEAAKATGADAIHPGYGFLSENGEFARLVLAAGIKWVGPSPEVIDAMGDKIAAKRLAVAASVPTLKSSENPGDADEVGYPLIVKAAAGGGGKGMRVVDGPDQLSHAVAAARREAASGFGDDRVFLERYIPRSRHVEIQILGDGHGNLVHLGERECSIQRRHQKIIEESPSPVVDAALRDAMGRAALALAESLKYRSAGTVEFLLDEDTREFFFLEVNTRLQVEHPVTEAVTGLDLVREQLRVAAGEPLGYTQDAVRLQGHAIEARLYAEDPTAGFLPATGTLAAFEPPAEPALRWDTGVRSGTVVGLEFDPMLAKVISHAPTRGEAAASLALALERLHIGGVRTNTAFLAATLRDPAFRRGETTSDFIERVRPDRTVMLADNEFQRIAVAVAMWLQCRNRAEAPVWGELPSGWRNARLPAQQTQLAHDGDQVTVRYRAHRDGSFVLEDGRRTRVYRWHPTGIDLVIDDRREWYRITASGIDFYVQTRRGTVSLHLVSRDDGADEAGRVGGLLAPMPGVVSDLRVSVGDAVRARQVLVVLEAMKMEHHLAAPDDGVVSEVLVKQGSQVDNGALLLVLAPAASEVSGDGAGQSAS